MDKKITNLNKLLDQINGFYSSQVDDEKIDAAISEFKSNFLILKNDSNLSLQEKININRHTIEYSMANIREYTFLHLMVLHGMPEDVKWALDNGWEPNYYPFNNKDQRKRPVTPVGLAAYTFASRQLKVLLDNGGDPFLKFNKPDQKHIPEWGSTLLYRVMSMPAKVKNNKLQTIKTLIPYYEDLSITTQSGRTIIDNSIDDIGVKEILEAISKREQQKLNELPELNKKFPDAKKLNRI